MLDTSYEDEGYDGELRDDERSVTEPGFELAPAFVRADWRSIDLANAERVIGDALDYHREAGYISYDGVWWFEAWGAGDKDQWRIRRDNGRPPTPDELVRADYIVLGYNRNGRVSYKTRVGGLDLL